ncbi:MAG: ISAzo13-like element transposase-related protein, partial [Pseudonocardiales bacterium]
GDPESPLRWTTKSTRHIAGKMTEMGHPISHTAAADLLHSLGYCIRSIPGEPFNYGARIAIRLLIAVYGVAKTAVGS